MNMKAVELSDAALKGIGFVVTPRERPTVPPGTDFQYAETKHDLGLVAPLSTGSLECAPRPMTVVKMERHLKTREMLIALDGDAVVCVAPPQEPVGNSLTGVVAVKMRRGEAFVMETAAWHWIPFPTGKKTVRYLVVFRNQTGADDLHFCDFKEAVTVIE
jgi:ureidoglycolate hydrolase